MRDDRTVYSGEIAGGPKPEPALQRAPLAAAAVLGVLAGGAAFLAFAMSRPTIPAMADGLASTKIAADAAEFPQPTADRAPRLQIANQVDSAGPRGAEEIRVREASDVETVGDDGNALTPRLKPNSKLTDAAPLAAGGSAAILSLAAPRLAGDDDRPPPFFFQSDIETSGAAHVRAVADGDVAAAPHEMRIVLARGETFVDALRRAGVRAEDRNQAAYVFGKHYNLRRLLPGQEIVLTVAEPNRTLFQAISEKEPPPVYLLAMDFRVDPENRITLARAKDGGYSASETATPLTTRIASVEGRIDGSLYASAKRQGAPDEVIAGLAQVFAYDVDFQREIFGGDEFEAIFEVRFDDAGKMVGGGDILFGRLKWRGRQKEKHYYRFETADGAGKADYFDYSGKSARRLLMKTPIDGARLSSGFGTRKHPILGYQKAHKGVDFAASRGTPIMAAGDGVIERAGPYGSFGNYVRIRHAQGYKTAYAHMNSIKKGVRTGARVRQGDVIGYVGATGRSTGPHLHYEVHLKDIPVNPQSLKIATGIELGGKDLSRFKEVRDRVDTMRSPHAGEDASLLADAKEKNKAL